MRRRGFNLVEVIIAMIFFALVLVGFLSVASTANRQSMDTYYEFAAMQAALEPLEIFRAAGFDLVANYAAHPLAEFPPGWNDLRDEPNSAIRHPLEWQMFRREITVDPPQSLPGGNGRRAVRIRIRVEPKQASRAAAWLSRGGVAVEGLIVELPK
ncbi:MAG TPA: hypothetical protein PLU72_03815 [Candidatus Ozemobacteraceae bacterium]|nr:hypothetical protein [Candidatus Ozemobacteraceae bacterium]